MATLNLQISSNANDCDQDCGYNASLYGNFIELGYVGFPAGHDKNGGFRFGNVTIPRYSTITSATLQISRAGSDADDKWTRLKISAVAADSSNAWSTSYGPCEATKTTASVDWDKMGWASGWHTSPDISSVIQEIVNRSGWSSGNNLSLCVMNDGSDAYANVQAYAHDFSAGNSAKLDITYEPVNVVVRASDFSSPFSSGPPSYTRSFTTLSGYNNVLLAMYFGNQSGGIATTGCTFNSVSMTRLTHTDYYSSEPIQDVYYLENPSIGTYNAVLSATHSLTGNFILVQLSGVNLDAGGYGQISAVQGGSVTYTPDRENSFILEFGSRYTTNPGVPATHTTIVNSGSNNRYSAAAYRQLSGKSEITHTWSLADPRHLHSFEIYTNIESPKKNKVFFIAT